jgi:hypothetical protein
MFFVPCIVIQLCNVNQQNALFKLMFNSILLVFHMLRISYVHHQEDHILLSALYGTFFMHLCKQSGRLEDVLDTYMKNIPYKATCAI